MEAYLLVVFLLVPSYGPPSAPPLQYILHEELLSDKSSGADCERQAGIRKRQLSLTHKGRRLAHQCFPMPPRSLT